MIRFEHSKVTLALDASPDSLPNPWRDDDLALTCAAQKCLRLFPSFRALYRRNYIVHQRFLRARCSANSLRA